MSALTPSLQPPCCSAFLKAAIPASGCRLSDRQYSSTPIRRISPDCCARAESGHAEDALASSVTKSRRLMDHPSVRGAYHWWLRCAPQQITPADVSIGSNSEKLGVSISSPRCAQERTSGLESGIASNLVVAGVLVLGVGLLIGLLLGMVCEGSMADRLIVADSHVDCCGAFSQG